MEQIVLIVDGRVFGTGLRDTLGVFIEPETLPLSAELLGELEIWVEDYEAALFKREDFETKIQQAVDKKGIALMKKIAKELGEGYALKYFSDFLAKELVMTDDGKLVAA